MAKKKKDETTLNQKPRMTDIKQAAQQNRQYARLGSTARYSTGDQKKATRQRAADIATGSVTKANSKTTNSSTSAKKSPYNSSTASQRASNNTRTSYTPQRGGHIPTTVQNSYGVQRRGTAPTVGRSSGRGANYNNKYGGSSARGDDRGIKTSATTSLREKQGVNLKTRKDVEKYDKKYADKLRENKIDQTVRGAGRQFVGGHISSLGTTAQELETTARSYNKAKVEKDNTSYSLRSREEAEKTRNSMMENIGRKEGVDIKNVERNYETDPNSISQKLIRKGDKLIEQGSKDIEKAKEGTGFIGRVAVDLGANALQMAGDRMLAVVPGVGQALAMGSLMNRAGGTASYEARQDGMNADQQFMYQQGTALIEGLSEGIFNSVSAFQSTYGKGAFSLADKVSTKMAASNIVQNFLKTPTGKAFATNLARLGAQGFEEGIEEVVADIAEPALKYALIKSTDPSAKFEGYNVKDIAYDFMIGALMGGLPGGIDAMRGVSADVQMSQAMADGKMSVDNLISQGLVQGREGANTTNAEVLANQMRTMQEQGKEIQPIQVRMLQEALGQSAEANANAFERRGREETAKATEEGRLQTSTGTATEESAYQRGTRTVEEKNVERVKSIMGEDASQTSTEALGRVLSGSADIDDHTTILADSKAREAVEELTGEKLSVNNAKARDQLETLTLANEIANEDSIRKEVQTAHAEDIAKELTSMSNRGGEIFKENYDEAVKVIGSGTEYLDVFQRLYTDGTVKESNFDEAYNRIVLQRGGAVAEFFTEPMARKAFNAGRVAIVAEEGKAIAKSKANKSAETGSGISFEGNAKNKISKRQADLLGKFAERANVHIRIVETISTEDGGGANGMYKDGIIYIAADSDNKLITVAKHELTHHIRQTAPESYQELEDFVFKKWYDSDANAMEEKVARYQKLYDCTAEEAREEIIADASEAFFTDEASIQEVLSFSEKLGKAIHDGIHTLLDNFLDIQDTDKIRDKGYGEFLKDIDILKDAEQMWLKALNESVGRGKNAEVSTEAQTDTEAKKSLKVSDQAYMDAVNKGDMKTAQKMVDEEAKRHGLTSRLMHGTNSFGFTTVEYGKGDDHISFFATDNEEVASSYVRPMFDDDEPNTYVRSIGKPIKNRVNEQSPIGDIINALNKVRQSSYKVATEEIIKNETDEQFRYVLEDAKELDRYTLPDKVQDVIEKVANSKDPQEAISLMDSIKDVHDIYYNDMLFYQATAKLSSLKSNVDLLKRELQWTPDNVGYWDINGHKNFVSKADVYEEYLDETGLSGRGIYELYASTNSPLTVYCNGSTWDNIKTKGEMADDLGQTATTRQIAKWAYDHGYGTVIFDYVRDTGKYGDRFTNPSTVYAFLEGGNNLIKSADPVTYDDNGDVIPLSKRFTEMTDDIRYSRKEYTPDEMDEHRASLMREAEENYGKVYTKDFNESGYVFPNGKMLKMGAYGQRGEDHAMAGIAYDDISYKTYEHPKAEAQNRFINEGNIRYMPENGWINLGTEIEPTYDQYAWIEDAVRKSNEGITMVEFTGLDGATKASKEYDRWTSADEIVGDIKRFYQTGEIGGSQLSQFRYSKKTKEDIENLGNAVTEGGTVTKFSLKSWAETDVAKLRQYLIDAGFDADAVNKWIEDVNSTASVLMNNQLDYVADRTHNALKPNSEYYFTLDLSTLCAKRRLYQGTYNAIMHRMKNAVLLPKDAIHLRALMAENYEVPCGICYEESRKKNEAKFANQWLNGKKTKKNPWEGYANMEHDDPYIPTLADVLTTDGRSWLRANHPEALESYLDFQKKRGSANPKVSLLHTDYRGDILNMTQKQVDNVKDIGGLRIQSFSDFELPHVLDMMQAVLDMRAMGLTSQAYTKVPAFAEIFGGTGIKINLSLIGEVKNGKLVFDDKEGINSKEAFKLRDKFSQDVGTIIVGANPESVLAAWKDPRIDMVIPFHRSGWSKAEFEALGLGTYTDFQKYQSERYLDGSKNGITLAEAARRGLIPKEDAEELFATTTNEHLAYWDKNKSGKENAELYLKKCAELHRRPVFYELLQDNGDGTWSLKADGSTDGYWKSLVDFKMYDNDGKFAPQKEVKPIFNMTAAKRLIEAYKGDPDTLPTADDVVEQFIKDYEGGRKYRLADDQKTLDKDLPKIDKNSKYSRKDPDSTSTATTQNTIAKLEEQVADLKAEFKRTNLKTANQKDVRIQAGRLIQRHGSNMQAQTSLMDTFNKIFGLYKEKGTKAFDEVYEIAKDEAVNIVNNIGVIHNEGAEEYKAIKQYLRVTPIQIDEAMKRNITDYNDFRKRNFGRLKLVNGENSNIDNVYMKLAELFPAQFTEDYVNPHDQLNHIIDVLDNYAPFYESLDGASEEMQDYVVDIAADIMETAYNLQTKKTFADKKYEEKVKAVAKAREEALASRGRELERQQKRYEKKLETLKAAVWEANERTAAERLRGEMDMQRLKEQQREKEQNKRERRAESEAKTKLLKIARRLDKYKTTEEMRKEIDSLIGDLDLVSKGMTSKTVNKLYDLAEWYENMKENDPDFIADEGIEKKLSRLTKKHIKDMTLDEVRDLYDVLSNIENELRTSKKFIDSEMRKEVKEAGRETIKNVNASKGITKALRNFDGFFINGTLSPVRQIRRVTGYVDSDPLYIATKELADGQRKMLDYQMNSWKAFDRFMNDKKFIASLNGAKAQEIEVTGTVDGEPYNVKITPDIRMAMYLASKDNDNLRHIKYGGISLPDIKLYKKGKIQEAVSDGTVVKFTPSQLREITSHMTEKEKQFADEAFKYFNETSPKAINETSEKLKGYSLAKVKNYFPIHTDTNFLSKDFDMVKFDGTIEGMGFLKERVKASNPIIMTGLVDTLTRSIEMNSKYVGLAIPVRNFGKLFGMKDVTYSEVSINGVKELVPDFKGAVQKSITKKWGDSVYNYIAKFVTDLQSGRRSSDDWENTFNKLRSRYAVAVLTLNASVAIKQAASYPTAAAVLGWSPLAKAMGNVGKVDLDLIAKYTPLQWYRSQGFSTTELGDIKSSNRKTLLEKVPALNWIQGMDVLTTRKLWKASEYYVRSHNKNLKTGTDEYYKAVADIYNRVIEETQPNYTTMQRPGLLRSDSSLVQMLNMFKTQPYQNFNILYDSIGNYVAKREQYRHMKNNETRQAFKNAGRDLRNSVSSQVAQLAVFAAMTSLWALFRRRDDKYKDEEGKLTFLSYLERLGKDMISNLFAVVPFGADIYGTMSSAITGEYYYGFTSVTDSSITDFLNAMTDGYKTVGEWIEYAQSDDPEKQPSKSLYKDTFGVVESASRFAGIPFSNMKNTWDGMFGWAAISRDGEYIGTYEAQKMSFAKDSEMKANLFKAYRNDKTAYNELRTMMIEDGFSEDSLDNYIKKQSKEHKSESEQKEYDNSMKTLEKSPIWKDASADDQKKFTGIIEKMSVGIEDSQTESITKKASGGLTEEQVILYKLALKKVDKPNSNGNLGTYTKDEKNEAIKLLEKEYKLTWSQKETLKG